MRWTFCSALAQMSIAVPILPRKTGSRLALLGTVVGVAQEGFDGTRIGTAVRTPAMRCVFRVAHARMSISSGASASSISWKQ